MGILNVTPDSFSDGGKFFGFERAIAQGEKMIADGADLIDIGGESTRPFSDAISEEEEIGRVLPVIEKLAAKYNVPISIDTTKSGVARRALEAGASIINDVGALRLDPELAEVAAKYDVPVILMHMKGTPKTMQKNPCYDDLIGEVKAFLFDRIDYAVKKGISRSKIIVDPGIGFGKTTNHNLNIIFSLKQFASLKSPIIIGLSRKAFIRNVLKGYFGKEFNTDHPDVEAGTQAAVTASILNGAHIVRVHDVAGTVISAKMADAIKNCA
jgi:dihydropteroate synthase